MQLIGAAQRVEHYEVAAYGTARAIAEKLGISEAAELLNETLEEEDADKTLTEVAEALYAEVPTGDEEVSENEEEQEVVTSAAGRRGAAKQRVRR